MTRSLRGPRGRGLDRDLVAVCIVVVLAAILAAAPVPDWLRTIVALPLVLICPGYALSCALFPPRFISRDERAIYTVVFSIVGIVLSGLLLQIVFPLDRVAWLILLLLLTWGGAAVGISRRPTGGSKPRLTLPRVPIVLTVGALAAAALAAAALAIGSAGEDRQFDSAHFTSLWIVPKTVGSNADELTVGVENHEGKSLDYRLLISSGTRLESHRRLTLAPGETWTGNFSAPPSPFIRRIFASLYQGQTLYRRVAFETGGTE